MTGVAWQHLSLIFKYQFIFELFNSEFMAKLKNIYIFLLISFFYLNIGALKSQEYFNVRESFDGLNSSEYCKDILLVMNGYVVMGGFAGVSNHQHHFGVLKIDLYGNTIEKKLFYSDSISGVDIGRNNGCLNMNISANAFYNVGLRRRFIDEGIGVLDEGIIAKFDTAFNLTWMKYFRDKTDPVDSSFFFEHVKILENDDLIIAGTLYKGNSSTSLLLKADSSGNELWRRYFESGSLNQGLNVIPTPDGGFALSCYKWVPQNNTSHNYLIKTDSLGNEQWRRFIGGLYADGPLYLANSPDSTIAGAYEYSDYSPPPPSSNSYNRIAVVKYNLQGDLNYEKIYGESILHRRVSSITPDSQGNFVVSGSNKFYPPEGNYSYEGSLLKVDNNGDFVWYRQYRHPSTTVSFNYLEGVTYAPEGGLAAVGVIYGFHPDPLGQDVWVIKVDSMGCINFDDCWVGEKELPLPHNETAMLRVHPNPAKDKIQLNFGPDELHLSKTLHLYDGFGRLQRTVELTPGQEEANISGLPAGIYIGVAMSREKQLGVFKFVVM
jgi:hypothetical protein